MGFVPSDARVLAVLPDSTLDLSITLHDHEGQQHFWKKPGHKKERPLFTAQCTGEVRHYGSFEIAQTPGSYFIIIFFTEKIKQNYIFSSKTF